MSNRWVRSKQSNTIRFGTPEGMRVRVFEGDMFSGATSTDQTLPLAEVKLLMPVQPGKILALWNNFHALGKN